MRGIRVGTTTSTRSVSDSEPSSEPGHSSQPPSPFGGSRSRRSVERSPSWYSAHCSSRYCSGEAWLSSQQKCAPAAASDNGTFRGFAILRALSYTRCRWTRGEPASRDSPREEPPKVWPHVRIGPTRDCRLQRPDG